ncbi:MAG: VacJ family lipoprotein [Pseudomonadota bacterium]
MPSILEPDSLTDVDERHDTADGEIRDPLERANRVTFTLNETADRYLLGPIARGYGYVTPAPAKAAFRRAVSNLGGPSRLINDLLQGEFVKAGETASRFVLNSTVGVAGLFDIGDKIGLEHHETNFERTLEKYGLETGPYVVLPLMGPSSVRGAIGLVGDIVLDPLGQSLPGSTNFALGGAEAIVVREQFDDQIEFVRDSSIDHYATVRSIYGQQMIESDELSPFLIVE